MPDKKSGAVVSGAEGEEKTRSLPSPTNTAAPAGLQARPRRRTARELLRVEQLGPNVWRVKFAGRAAFECTGSVLIHVLWDLDPADRHALFRKSLAQMRSKRSKT